MCYFSLTGSQESPRLFYPGRNVCLLSPILASLSFWPWSSTPYPTAKKHKNQALNIQTSHSSAFYFRLIPPLDRVSKKREQINNSELEESIRITDKFKPYVGKKDRTSEILTRDGRTIHESRIYLILCNDEIAGKGGGWERLQGFPEK